MNYTDAFNEKISQLLASRGIVHSTSYGVVLIDRTSMVQFYAKICPGTDEHAAYDFVLDLVKEVCTGARYVSWGSRSDDSLGVEVYLPS